MDKIEIIKLLLLVLWPIIVLGLYICYRNRLNIKKWFLIRYYRIIIWFSNWRVGRKLSKKKEVFQKYTEIKTGKYKNSEEEMCDIRTINYINNILNDQLILKSKLIDDNNIVAKIGNENFKLKLKDDVIDVILTVFNYAPTKFRFRFTVYFDHDPKDVPFYKEISLSFIKYQNDKLNKLFNNLPGEVIFNKVFVPTQNMIGMTELTGINLSKVKPYLTFSALYNVTVTEESAKIFMDNIDKYIQGIICGYIVDNLQKREEK